MRGAKLIAVLVGVTAALAVAQPVRASVPAGEAQTPYVASWDASDVKRADSVGITCYRQRVDGLQDVLWLDRGLPVVGSTLVYGPGGSDLRQEFADDSAYTGPAYCVAFAATKQGRVAGYVALTP